MAATTLCGILLVLSCKERLNQPKCNKPEQVYGNARLKTDVGDLERFSDGYEVYYKCQPGFVTSSSLNRRCSNGTWTSIQCTHRLCPDLDDPENGERLDANRFVGKRAHFRCNKGYILKGSPSLICRNDGEWRPSEPPVCIPVKCPPISRIHNGNGFQEVLDGQQNIFDKVVTFTCDPGFYLHGSKHRRCQADGTWSGVQPTCQVPSCPDLPPLYYGVIYYSHEGVQHPGNVAEVSCNEGTDLFPENFDGYVFCEGEDRPKWSISKFTCEAQHSVAPGDNMKLHVLHRYWWKKKRVTGLETFKSRTKLSAECDRNYEIFDNKQKEYTNKWKYDLEVFNGTVKPAFPTCKGKRCRLKPCDKSCLYNGGYPPGGLVEHQAQVTKVCKEDYEFKPENFRQRVGYSSTCDKGKIYFPECIRKRCIVPTGQKGDNVKFYSPEDLVYDGVTVEKSCTHTQELYFPNKRTYFDQDVFKTTCNVGQWSKPEFPVCKNKRCRLKPCDKSCLYNGGYPPGGLVEHQAQVTKVCKEDYEFKPENLRQRVGYSSTCDKGKIYFPECIRKRCKLPPGKKGDDIRTYLPEDLVNDGITVEKSCSATKELYYIDRKTYLDLDILEIECNVGQWSKQDFPVCRDKRCTIQNSNNTKLLLDKDQVNAGRKVPHGTTLHIECVTGYENHGPEKAICDKGKLLEDDPCRPKSCHLPAIENSVQNKLSRTLGHGKTLSVSCDQTHLLVKSEDRSFVGSVETKCLLGNLTVTLDGYICEPRGCSPIPNAKYNLLNKSGKPQKSERPSLFNHHQFASIKCAERFVLIKKEDNKETRTNPTMTTQCVFGDWEPRYECRKDSCEYKPPKKGYLDINGREQTGNITIDSGTKGKIMCNEGYYLYSKNRSESYQSYPIQCTGNELSVPRLICIRRCELTVNEGQFYAYSNGEVVEKKFIPSGKNVNLTCRHNYTLVQNGTNDDRGFAKQECRNGKLRPKFKCKLNDGGKKKVDGEIVTSANAATEVLPKLTSYRPLTVTTLQMTTPDDYVYTSDYEYNYYEEEHAKDRDNCSPPMNGMMKRSFLNFYDVTCDDGFTLTEVDNDHQYECVNGTLLNKYNMKANCKENKCFLSTELLSNMDVFGNKSRNEVYLSADSTFDAGSKVLFDCKKQYHEPVNRMFKCRKGQWIAADEDTSWSMTIDSVNSSSCRPAECNRCVFGDCIKDRMCTCHQGAFGKDCATPVCHELCKKNGGRCVRPSVCICSTVRYGDNCEEVGCTLPPENDHLSFKRDGLPAMFEKGAVLSNDKITCPHEFSLSTNKDLICNGDNKWSEEVFCIPEAKYEIEVTIGTELWAGSWNRLYVSFIGEEGQTTPRFLIGHQEQIYGLHPGKKYNANIRTHYIGKIKRLQFTLDGYPFDSLQLQYVSFKVTRGGKVEEYAIQRTKWMLENTAPFDVDQAAVTNYTLTFSANRKTISKVTVVIRGTEGSTEEFILKHHGWLTSATFSRLLALPSIGEINEIEVNVEDRSPIVIKYLQLIDQKRNKSYISFSDGQIRGQHKLQVYDLLRPDCAGNTFLPGQNGYLRGTRLAKHHGVKPWQDCKDLCRKDESCTAVVVQSTTHVKDCYLVSAYSLSPFIFAPNKSNYKIYFRACS